MDPELFPKNMLSEVERRGGAQGNNWNDYRGSRNSYGNGGNGGNSGNSGSSFFGGGNNNSSTGGGGKQQITPGFFAAGGNNSSSGGGFFSGGGGSSNNSGGGGFFNNNGSGSGSGGGFFAGNNNSSSGGFFNTNSNNNSNYNNNSNGGFFNNRSNNSGSNGYGFFNGSGNQAPPIFVVTAPSYSGYSGDEWHKDHGLRSDTSKLSRLLQILPEGSQKIIELESLTESEKRDALQKLALERDLRLQERIEYEKYRKHEEHYLDDYFRLNEKKFYVPPPRSFFPKPVIAWIPSKTLKPSLRNAAKENALTTGKSKTPIIGDPAFVIHDRPHSNTKSSLNNSVLSSSRLVNRNSSVANIVGEIEFADHRVYFSTTVGTQLSLEEIKKNILSNWCQREKYYNNQFECATTDLQHLVTKAELDIENLVCRNMRVSLSKFVENTDLDFDELRIIVRVKIGVAWMGVHVSKEPPAKISMFGDAFPADHAARPALRHKPGFFRTEQVMEAEYAKKLDSASLPTTTPGTKDKLFSAGSTSENPYRDPPRVFTSSLPKMSINPESMSLFCSGVPKQSTQEFRTVPTIQELQAMKPEQLRNVEGFRASNQYGSVIFCEPVDVSGVDLAEAILINKNIVDVYPRSRFNHDTKPRFGEKLNRRAILEFYNVGGASADLPNDECLAHLESMNDAQVERWDQDSLTLTVFMEKGF
jgi:Nucleoporin autopeptidase